MSTICYVLHEFPVLSQTFIWNEIFGVEEAGFKAEVTYLNRSGEQFDDYHVLKLVERSLNLNGWLGSRERWTNHWRLALRGQSSHVLRQLGVYRDDPHHRYIAERLARRAMAVRAGHFHAHFAGDASRMAMAASAISGIPYSFTMHGNDVHFAPPTDLHLQAKRAKFVITVSEANRSHLIETLGVPAEKIKVVRSGIRIQDFHPKLPVDGRRRTRFLTVARLHPVKGLDIMLKAVARLADRRWDWVIVGEGPQRASLQAESDRLGLGDCVRFLGARVHEDLPSIYREADVFVLPSRSEGLGVVLIEAMACGLPIVASRVGGIPEVAQEGSGAFLFEPGDAEELAAALQRFLQDPTLATRMGSSNRTRAVREFSIERQVTELLALWSSDARPVSDD